MQEYPKPERVRPVEERRILIAEETPMMRTWLKTALARFGVPVDEAATAKELFDQLDSPGLSLVICSKTLGSETAEEILSQARTKGSKAAFLLISPFFATGAKAKLERLGPADVLEDPLDTAKLGEIAEKLLAHDGLQPPPYLRNS